MMRRWLVIYYNGDDTKAVIIEDSAEDGTVRMPFGVEPHQVADDCELITAIVELPSEDIPMVVIDDQEYDLDPADPDVDVEDVPAEDEDED
jgi:hypothetical protein